MRDDEFEWDVAKALANSANHGVAFEVAREVFGDPYTVYWVDDRFDYDETRYSAIGSAQGRVLYVAYTMTDERVRIISARRAEPREQRRYHEAKT
jgi:uncharacterized DUF497 family protein